MAHMGMKKTLCLILAQRHHPGDVIFYDVSRRGGGRGPCGASWLTCRSGRSR